MRFSKSNILIKAPHPLQRRVIQKLIDRIIEFYGDDLVSLAIFGSFARGEAKLNSDLDILIILKQKEGIRKEIDRFLKNVESFVEEDLQKLFEKYGINMEISPFILSLDDAKFFNPIYLDMVGHSIIILDRENFLKRILDRVRERIHKFKKHEVGATYAWDVTKENLTGEKLL